MTQFERFEAGANRPVFSAAVPADGYRWWYIDGVSDDGDHGIVIIAFIGSVFSPYYFSARRRGPADPLDFCSINVALYGRRRRWCMTERRPGRVSRDDDRFQVAASSLSWRGDTLQVDIDERSMPMQQRVRGRVLLRPRATTGQGFRLDGGGHHEWHPIAPLADIEVELSSPDIRWTGHAYHDTNAGDRPLESDFRRWSWSRSTRSDHVAIDYAIEQRDGTHRELAIDVSEDGELRSRELPPLVTLPKGLWRVDRYAHADTPPKHIEAFEDTPFYTRSLLHYGEQQQVHEFLDLDRFRSRWVQLLLPFRMPRLP